MAHSATISDKKQQIVDWLEEANKIRTHDLTKSIALTEQALSLSIGINNKSYKAKSLSNLSLFHMIIGNNDRCQENGQEAIKLFEEIGDEKGIADAKFSISGTYYKSDNFNTGLKYLQECLEIYEKHEDHYNISRVYKAIGSIYDYFRDTKSAKIFYKKAIIAGEKAGDKNLVSNAFNPLSGILIKENRLDQALKMIEKAISLKEETNDIRGLAFSLYGRGKVYTHLNRYEEAEKDFSEAIELQMRMGDKLGLAMAYRKLAQLFYLQNELTKAKKAALDGLTIAEGQNISYLRYNCYYVLYLVAKKVNHRDEMLDNLEKYIEIKDRVVDGQALKIIESYETMNKMQSLEKDRDIQKKKLELSRKKNLELDSFFYRISHDLKGPITSMLSLSYLAKLELKEEKSHKFLDEFEKQANRLNDILTSLLHLTKLSFTSDAKQEIDFQKIVNDCVESYKYLDNFDKVDIQIDLASSIQYHAEWSLVNTIVQNLIENGIKYARFDDGNDPHLRIKVAADEKNIYMTVEDNGVGMNKEETDQIFKMFYRANRQIQGTGLGLHILKRAIERLKGDVSVTSQENIGTAFSVTLPLRY